jgi:hypothetical protein
MSDPFFMRRTMQRKMMLARKERRLWWGDYETMTIAELKEDNARIKKNRNIPKEKESKLTKFDIAVIEYLKKEELTNICPACGIYKRHSNPPRDWAPEDYKFCCLHCRDMKGVSHGTRCQKCVVVQVKAAFDEDNGY